MPIGEFAMTTRYPNAPPTNAPIATRQQDEGGERLT
jgi:hypothetical protein